MSVYTIEMKNLTAVVLEEHSDTVKKELLRLGVLDFVEVSSLTKEHQKNLTTGQNGDDEKLKDVRVQIESLFKQMESPLPVLHKEDIDTCEPFSLEPITSFLEKIYRSLSNLREKQKNNTQSLLRLHELQRYIREKKHTYIDIHIGSLPSNDYQVLNKRLSLNANVLTQVNDDGPYVLLTFTRDRSTIENTLDTLKWQEDVDSLSQSEAFELLSKTLAQLIGENEMENRKILDEIQKMLGGHRDELEGLYRKVRLHELLGSISSHFAHTRNTTIFSGWVPAKKAEVLERAILKASDNQCVIEYSSERTLNRKEIPVALTDVPVLRPFQRIVNNYSTLEYGSVNPTIFVAVSYLAMFGLMFADAGQGVVIMLLGLWGILRERKGRKEGAIITFSLQHLMVYLGAASIVAGILFGSYFGFSLFPPLWFDYHGAVLGHSGGSRDVYTILGITIYFGIMVISAGLIINWINLIKKREYIDLVFSKNGILGAILFAVGIYAGSAFVASGYKTFPSDPALAYLIGIPLILLFFRVPIEHYIKKKEGPFLADSIMEWIVISLEIFSGYLANTLSFMRVAGLGIAHVSLMAAFTDIAALTDSIIGKVLIYIMGNALVIALEGLSAGIQSLRLNYYEFFTKFFVGEGRRYRPISLQSRD
ncbi:MAG: V-type ATPase 116kDa subunit family protein [Sphaerochaetaceae bacterium]|nr:V-type ATPase 116kDa subunit family protein [Sphaerochaetaceae bacterium]